MRVSMVRIELNRLLVTGFSFFPFPMIMMVNHHYHWKWKEAEAGYEQAIELNPDHADTHLWYSWLLLALGRRDAAFDELEQTMSIVQETDPDRKSVVKGES